MVNHMTLSSCGKPAVYDYGSFDRYLAIELNINCNRKIAEVIF